MVYFFDLKWINEIFRFFVCNGVDVMLCDNEGKNVIDYVFCCMWSVNLEVVKLLMLVLKIVICDVFCIIVVLNIGEDMLKILGDFELLELFLLNEG